MTLNEALDLLAVRVGTIDGITPTTDPNAEVVVGMAVVSDGQIDYNYTMKGGATVNFTVTVYVSKADEPAGLYEVREYLAPYGALSVRAALDTPVDGDAIETRAHVDTGQAGTQAGHIVAVFTGTVRIAADI
jgi:hypothetical protein